MRIDEFEFRNEKGQEIEPTKAMLVVYIKALHKDIKTLEKALDFAIEKLEQVKKWCEESSINWEKADNNKFLIDGVCYALKNVGHEINHQIKELKKEIK